MLPAPSVGPGYSTGCLIYGLKRYDQITRVFGSARRSTSSSLRGVLAIIGLYGVIV